MNITMIAIETFSLLILFTAGVMLIAWIGK